MTSTVPLQVTPGAPALVGGTIVAPLPARGGVALISSGASADGARFVATGPLAYTAGAGTGSLAYVANAGDGTITLVDVAKGKALAARPGLGAARRCRSAGDRPPRRR